ncbi:hypothetical protein L1987_34440 [Smallanthus sonchifolius]|uniref:Uncharacterized protein n=1 Tax=Smallanthus sonchifolius TaxID=185202 RepID=A0ACB9HV88_9ASTR|nr:hypothetical protein L1987_34440 [Smallanthus sonchifolius]
MKEIGFHQSVEWKFCENIIAPDRIEEEMAGRRILRCMTGRLLGGSSRRVISELCGLDQVCKLVDSIGTNELNFGGDSRRARLPRHHHRRLIVIFRFTSPTPQSLLFTSPSQQLTKMSTPSRKRLMRDFKRLQQDPPAGISGAPYDNNIMLWNAVIFGPDDTPWDGGTFKLTLQFSEDYPNKPPTVRFISRMFHPNIYADGSICLDILQNQWSPIYDVAAILTSIQSLLCDPNPNSPANSEAARLFSENKRDYNRKVREVVEQSWTAD